MKRTIRSKAEINQLFNEASKSTLTTMIFLAADELQEKDSQGRVAYIAGKKLGAAPKRSRAKRLLREAAKLNGAPWQGLRVVLVAREGLANASLEKVSSDIAKALDQHNIVR